MQVYIHLFCQMWIWGSKDGESSYSVTYNVMVAFLHEIWSHEIFGNWVFLSNQMLILTPAKVAHKWTEERCGKIYGAVQLNFFDGYWTQCNIFRRNSIGKLNIALDSAQLTFSPRKKSTNWRQENNKVYLFYHWFTSAHLYSYKVLDSTVVVYRLMPWTLTSHMGHDGPRVSPTRHEDLHSTAFPNSIIMLAKEGNHRAS
jgi:hypothetical protein